MSFVDPAPPAQRARTAVIVGVLHLMLGYALVTGLRVDMPQRIGHDLALIVLPLPKSTPKPPPPAPHKARAPRREGASAPANLEARATPVVAPVPILPMPVPPTIIVAPLAGPGAADHAGAAPIIGPGSGSGGEGQGTGNGDDGDGPGGGGDGGTPLRWIKGRIKDSDYPRSLLAAGVEGTVGLRFVVGVKGRVTECHVTRSSGNAQLDAITCQLLTDRLRYRPTLNAAGRPVPDTVIGEHRWYAHGGREEPDDDPDDG